MIFFVQNFLIKSNVFEISNDKQRYIAFHESYINRDFGRPRILTQKDYLTITNGSYHFATKVDPAQDSRLLDMLDARILQGSKK